MSKSKDINFIVLSIEEITLAQNEMVRKAQFQIVALQCFKKCPLKEICQASTTTEITRVYQNGRRMSGKTEVKGLKVGESGCTLSGRFADILTYSFKTK